jgi:hypothetical protein
MGLFSISKSGKDDDRIRPSVYLQEIISAYAQFAIVFDNIA